jgi:serine protease
MRSVAALTAVVALCTVMVQGRQSPAPAWRAVVHEIGLHAMDRGLRDQDPPRAARTQADAERFTKDGAAPLPYMPGSLIVKYKNDPDTFDVVAIPPNTNPEAMAAAMATRPDVEYAQPRYRNYAMSRPNDPLYANQWNFPAIDMERAWDIQPGATSEIIVAVLDSGMAFRTATVRYNSRFAFRVTPGGPLYPALGLVDVPFAAAPELGTSGSSRFVAPRDFIWNDDLPVDLDGHGTHVAGTIGQLTNNSNGTAGMAYNVRLMPVKIIQGPWDEIFSSPFEGTDDVVARGIRYAADNGAKVLNLSIGRTAGGPAPVVAEALRYAVSRGAFVAVASGNTRDAGNQANRLAQLAAEIDGVVAVGAIGRTLDIAYYSTTGSYVEISAPGGDQRQGGTTGGILQQTLDFDLLETYERPVSQFGPPRADAFQYFYLQGTSMATPHVSGFAALLMQQGITDPAAIEAAMKRFATDKGAPGKDDQFGHGLINPRATLRGLGLAK